MDDLTRAAIDNVDNYRVDLTRLLYMLHMDVDALNRQADAKAQIFLGVNAVLLATIANVAPGFARALLHPAGTPVLDFGIALTLAMVVLLALSIASALQAISPKLVPTDRANLMFFGKIAQYETQQAYVDAFRQLPLESVKDDVLHQVHVRSTIVNRKFRIVGRAGRFLLAGVIVWTLSRLVLAFT